MISEPVCDVDEEVSCALHCFCMTLWCPFPPVMLPDLETLSRTERKLSSLVFMLTQVLLQITNNIHHLRYPPSGRHFKACIDCWHWMQEAWLRLLSLVPDDGETHSLWFELSNCICYWLRLTGQQSGLMSLTKDGYKKNQVAMPLNWVSQP